METIEAAASGPAAWRGPWWRWKWIFFNTEITIMFLTDIVIVARGWLTAFIANHSVHFSSKLVYWYQEMPWYDNASNMAGKYESAQALLKCDWCGTLSSMLWLFTQSCKQWICKLRQWSDYIFRSSSEHIHILHCDNTSLENFVSVTVDSDSEISKSNTVVCMWLVLMLQKRFILDVTKYSMFFSAKFGITNN